MTLRASLQGSTTEGQDLVLNSQGTGNLGTKFQLRARFIDTDQAVTADANSLVVKDAKGNAVLATGEGSDGIEFKTSAGETYFLKQS